MESACVFKIGMTLLIDSILQDKQSNTFIQRQNPKVQWRFTIVLKKTYKQMYY